MQSTIHLAALAKQKFASRSGATDPGQAGFLGWPAPAAPFRFIDVVGKPSRRSAIVILLDNF